MFRRSLVSVRTVNGPVEAWVFIYRTLTLHPKVSLMRLGAVILAVASTLALLPIRPT